jgi:hypothetical protein
LTSPPAGRRRRATTPSSSAQHRIREISYGDSLQRSWHTYRTPIPTHRNTHRPAHSPFLTASNPRSVRPASVHTKSPRSARRGFRVPVQGSPVESRCVPLGPPIFIRPPRRGDQPGRRPWTCPARSRPARSDRSGVGRSQPVNLNFARAMSGWRRYGKGRHQAGLNFGDCFTYALAERTGHPVLCAGDDFAATEITVVRHQPTSAEG